MKPDIHVLVVHDSRSVREFAVQAITGWEGFAAQEACDGAEGVEMALANLPDLILLALDMPRLDGFQILGALQEHQVDVPVVLITPRDSEAIPAEMFRQGVKDYVTTPFTAEQLQAAVERGLAEVRLRREADALNQRLSAANRQLRRRLQELDTLYQVGKSVTSLLSPDQVLERILDAVFRVIGPEEATLMLMDEEGGQLRRELHRQHIPGEVHHVARRSADELAASAASTGDATSSGAMMCAPLKLGDRTIGVLAIGNRVSGHPISDSDRQLLLALADYAVIAIENARLYDQVQQADHAKSEFVSVVAHELRTPMTSIRGYADLLVKGSVGPLTEQQEAFALTILRNVDRMQVVVSDLRDVSRIETGNLRLNMQPVRITEALDNALQATQTQIDAQSLHLSVKVPQDPPSIYADPTRLAQVLINLLSNACKYTPQGGDIRVRAWQKDDRVHCAVSDTGVGISPEDQACLFTKFFRSDDPAVRAKPGTGLGLCIVKSLVELQGGEVQVESHLGKGTTFTFTMPVAAPALAPA